jgi:formiminotetrahydrofolate cyclodeaminase
MTPPSAAETETLEALLARMASASPAVGGGAAASLTGATAAALVAMVAGVAARRADPAGVEPLQTIAGDAEGRRARLIALIAVDVNAYDAVLAARRRPPPARADATRQALVRATEVPLDVAREAGRVLELAATLEPRARPSTLGDLAVAATLAWAALEAAALTARVNLAGLDAPAFVESAGSELERLVAHGATLRERITRACAGRA